jgi:hypothetical protein
MVAGIFNANPHFGSFTMNLIYASGVLGQAVYALATGPDGIHSRLKAAVREFSPMQVADLPADLAAQYTSIRNSLRVAKPGGDGGRVAASITAMTEDQAVELAKQIVHLDMDVRERRSREDLARD